MSLDDRITGAQDERNNTVEERQSFRPGQDNILNKAHEDEESRPAVPDQAKPLLEKGGATSSRILKCVRFEALKSRIGLPPFVGFSATWLSILYWLLNVAIVTLSWVAIRAVKTLKDPVLYGLFQRWSGLCSDFSTIGGKYGTVIFALNIAAALVIASSDHFRTQVVAPSPTAFQRTEINLGVQSLSAFKAASGVRKAIFVALLLTSIPLYFLSNSLLFIKYSASNIYEVVMSTSYLDGHAFNVSALGMSQWPRDESRNLPPLDAQWPIEYDDVPQLTAELLTLQEQPSRWTNLSRLECGIEYNKAEYSKYGTLVIVTNYTTPDLDNSALAIGVLPGYRLANREYSLLALCPDAYLATYKASQRPTEAPYMPTLDESAAENPQMLYVSPDEARKLAQVNVTDGSQDMPYE
ncbi:MAG: hypothetical protein M1821_003551 [Bathelium mastoideum]|nr:MAG: hypothetical protein M1821_003551 [Bathelium mastoideum]KAI9682637.1 MAG: hypothetical protein M1822_006935 [Bathelium mastoideum]